MTVALGIGFASGVLAKRPATVFVFAAANSKCHLAASGEWTRPWAATDAKAELACDEIRTLLGTPVHCLCSPR